MLPVLFEIPWFDGDSFKVYSYAALMVLGYLGALAALFVVTPKEAGQEGGGLTRGQVWD